MTAQVPLIYHLSIERFRGITDFSWYPASGVNVILGGGDVGKTTVLDAIALLLSPTNPTSLSDADYHRRDIDAGFSIEAVFSIPPSMGIAQQLKPSWPWVWNGSKPVVPAIDEEGPAANEPVYRLRVRGTADLEYAYEILQPDGNADSLPIALRRAIGLVRLGGDDRNDRDLRLVQGSALDRLLSDKGLRSRLGSELAKNDVQEQLLDRAKETLKNLDESFQKQTLPSQLELAITGSQGIAITALIGLTADREGVQLPLASWGAGTRRLAALAIAEQNQGESPITVVDEIERGLEPYRQRALMEKLQAGSSQVFVTTHSAAALSSVSEGALWYVDHGGRIGSLDATKTGKHQKRDPDAFLARLTIVAEGVTEVGFVKCLLEKALGSSLERHGVHVTDGGGHEATLDLLEAIADAGLRFCGFADDEDKHPTRWLALSAKLGPLLFKWGAGCLEENVIARVPDEKLPALIDDPAGEKTGMRLRTLADRLNIQEKDPASIMAKAGTGFRELLEGAATGTVPGDKTAEKKQYQKHAQTWFKTLDGGRELAEKLFDLDIWPTLKPQFMPFLNGVRTAIGLNEITDINQ